MSYTPHEWQNNEFITAEKLNHIEEGIAAGGGGAVIITDNGTQLDKTYAEIYALVNSGTPCYIKWNQVGSQNDLDTDYSYSVVLMPVVSVFKYDVSYRVYASCAKNSYISPDLDCGNPSIFSYQASVSTDYPTFFRKTFVNSANLSVVNDRFG